MPGLSAEIPSARQNWAAGSGPRRPALWCYPEQCANGEHKWGQARSLSRGCRATARQRWLGGTVTPARVDVRGGRPEQRGRGCGCACPAPSPVRRYRQGRRDDQSGGDDGQAGDAFGTKRPPVQIRPPTIELHVAARFRNQFRLTRSAGLGLLGVNRSGPCPAHLADQR
jgi:hypothetical protein